MHAHSTQEELDRNAPLFAMFATLGLVWYCLHTVFNTGNVFTPLVAVWALTAIQHKHAQGVPGEYVLAQYIQALNAICVLVCVYAAVKTAVMKTEWAGRTTWAAAKVDNDGYETVD
ncbi:hypothetical protein SARC_13666 [Sphaeroforma arctica JP610]|uniref:Uncharacterized protein n=1 Tax=Sphaeroforma arctica JP610 TaxID=667725 RepID=A0A0L0FCH4_9EUKA|nr:hypothetical protein SARC_13666 [Sphaeroforma arctica JP610]KNC73778.1 hypothetical protein SARC_13666 [Sphaeroforma arctica JP610]|eukprot:XP_014147680.1 hypothetical protein SARC_13666 [Sphaeroforma arctica JP610]